MLYDLNRCNIESLYRMTSPKFSKGRMMKENQDKEPGAAMPEHQRRKKVPRKAPKGLEKYAQLVWEKVEESGWAVVSVMGASESEKDPGYAYTVGLFENYSHPELMIAGLPRETSAGILNQLGLRVSKGENFEICEPVDRVIRGHKARFSSMDPSWIQKMMGLNDLYIPIEDLPAIQTLWPDEQGLFPDEVGCDISVKRLQPLCANPPKKKSR